MVVEAGGSATALVEEKLLADSARICEGLAIDILGDGELRSGGDLGSHLVVGSGVAAPVVSFSGATQWWRQSRSVQRQQQFFSKKNYYSFITAGL